MSLYRYNDWIDEYLEDTIEINLYMLTEGDYKRLRGLVNTLVSKTTEVSHKDVTRLLETI